MTKQVQNKLDALLSSDPDHFYTDEELDAIEEVDMAMALRIARVQHIATSQQGVTFDPTATIDPELLNEAITEVRKILSQDGGDIELDEYSDHTVYVRMKGACVGCPNAVMDLKNVVERLVKQKVPGVKEVINRF